MKSRDKVGTCVRADFLAGGVTEKNLCEFFVGDLPLAFNTEVHANEIRIEIEGELFGLFRCRDNVLEIIEGDEAVPVTIEQLKGEPIQ